MTFPEFVGQQKVGTFKSLHEAQAAFTESAVCDCRETCFGICIACGKPLSIFSVPSDKSYILRGKSRRGRDWSRRDANDNS